IAFAFIFFFQAEDGIRDDLVTGVQTCALPICLTMVIAVSVTAAVAQQSAINGSQGKARRQGALEWPLKVNETRGPVRAADVSSRSEERRVGKEGRRVGARER